MTEEEIERERMTTWAERMHRRAASIGTVVTSCGHTSAPYPRRIEKFVPNLVKFGVPLEDVCRNDIPGPLLVMILRVNKEGPYKKDIFRAPGHQGNMKKLIHFLQNGRLVNLDNYSVYTIASVLKKFLRKLPEGIFGHEMEQRLFEVIQSGTLEQQWEDIHKLIMGMPVVAQRLLVLLFGTFRTIAMQAEDSHSGMTAEALGVSVAPSFFQSCVSGGKHARMEDVVRFKVATRVMKLMIDSFGVSNLFGRENYEYYARITGRILKVEEEWIFSFRYPSDAKVTRQEILAVQKSWLKHESERWGLNLNLEAMSGQEECQSTPALIHQPDEVPSLDEFPEAPGRLSISLGDNGIYQTVDDKLQKSKMKSSSSPKASQLQVQVHPAEHLTLDELRVANRYAESTRSLSYLPQVHERQTARMRTRSEWFLSPLPRSSMMSVMEQLEDDVETPSCSHPRSPGALSENLGTSARAQLEGGGKIVRRSSSKREKENGGEKDSTAGDCMIRNPSCLLRTGLSQILGVPPNRKPSRYTIESTKYQEDECMKDSFPGGPRWFPRRPDHEDSPVKPSKLFMVKRIVTKFTNQPYWEKKILKDFGLLLKGNPVAVVKNTPKTNALLWKVKHLVEITPIEIPENLPMRGANGEAPWGTQLTDDGQFLVPETVHPKVEELRLGNESVFDVNIKYKKSYMTPLYQKEYLKQKWLKMWEDP
ncbi:unnamed protein product [Darwinula stevensoni]|uniref:Rho-GAP domain-containing protein n=1 Tax=Darwinula stevensoni TaxID=69355 RepID=A0A7R8WZW2_9CRUS|nr:unnamed protein product [Darwinula stevensoni]CAG0880454.1 unnamed protein product [Darwinula stevensoni]